MPASESRPISPSHSPKPSTVKRGQCPYGNMCNLVPINVPDPARAQEVLHPRKDVFVLKVAKVGVNGIRRSKMELELVSPKYTAEKILTRIDTRETQCDPEPSCVCGKPKKK